MCCLYFLFPTRFVLPLYASWITCSGSKLARAPPLRLFFVLRRLVDGI